MKSKKKSKDYWDDALDDPLFYIPFIGPILHGVKKALEEEEEELKDLEEDEE